MPNDFGIDPAHLAGNPDPDTYSSDDRGLISNQILNRFRRTRAIGILNMIKPSSINQLRGPAPRIRRLLLPALAVIASASLAAAAPWSLPLLPPEALDRAEASENLSVLAEEDPASHTVLHFADPIASEASIRIDLSGMDLSDFDQLHFDLWMENEPVDIVATLRGYPDSHSGRRWYVSKRFQPLNEWTDIRLDLQLDDDLSLARFDDPEQSLVLNLKRPDAAIEPLSQARIRNIRLVRNPVGVEVDYRQSRSGEDDGLQFTYPVRLTNRSGEALDILIEVIPETLDQFTAALETDSISLAPGESREVEAVLSMDRDEASSLPPGYAERALIRITSPDLPGYDAIPIRGYRPVYLFGVVPPAVEDRRVFFEILRNEAERLNPGRIARIETLLDWEVETPPLDVTPAYGMTLRCPECNSLMDIDSLYVYFCHSRDIRGECPNHQKRFEVGPDHRFFRAMLDRYHVRNGEIARQMALAWLNTGDSRFGEKAMEILSAYEAMFRDLPLVSAESTGFHNRFRSSTLHERHVLEHFAEAYLALREGGFGQEDKLEAIANGLLLETLFNVNQHYYGASASQVDMVTQTMKAAVITGHWPFFADAVAGDSGMQRILQRTFNADGVNPEGGDYAVQSTRQILRLARFLEDLGVTVDRERMELIERNSTLMGYLPEPDDFEWKTLVMDQTGFSFLVHGKDATWRRATLNWGSSRERHAHDLLTYVFHDADNEKLIQRTRRIAWGRPEAFFSYQSVSQNIPVVDGGNIARVRLDQAFLGQTDSFAGLLVADQPGRRAYPDTHLTRAMILFNGALLVVDRLDSESGEERQFDFPLFGLNEIIAVSVPMEDFDGQLGESRAYQLPIDLQAGRSDGSLTLEWADGERGVKMRFLGSASEAFRGRTPSAWRGELRDFFMLRQHGPSTTAAFLYEATHGKHPRISDFRKVPAEDSSDQPVSDTEAIAYEVTFDNGQTARVLISLDGKPYRSGPARVSAEQRLEVQID